MPACLVCGQACSSKGACTKFECGCTAHPRCIAAWITQQWKQDGYTTIGPCPVCDTRELKALPPETVLVYIDKNCGHCAALDTQVGERGEWNTGFRREYVNSNHPRVQSIFPHTYIVDANTHEQRLTSSPVVNMFSMIAGVEPESLTLTID